MLQLFWIPKELQFRTMFKAEWTNPNSSKEMHVILVLIFFIYNICTYIAIYCDILRYIEIYFHIDLGGAQSMSAADTFHRSSDAASHVIKKREKQYEKQVIISQYIMIYQSLIFFLKTFFFAIHILIYRDIS